jgi:hypothetical protein
MIVTPTPAPWIVIPLLTRNVRVQLAVPAGSVTVSPSAAEAMAAATSDCDALFALIVVAPARLETVRIRVAASETRTVTRGDGVGGQRRFRTGLGLLGIHQVAALFRAPNPIRCLGAGKEDSRVVCGYEVEGKPERT